MVELALLIVAVWVLGPVVALFCALGIVVMVTLLVGAGVAFGIIWATTGLFGPTVGVPVGIACLFLLLAGWQYADWHSEQRDGAAKGPGTWMRRVARETPAPELALGTLAAATVLCFHLPLPFLGATGPLRVFATSAGAFFFVFAGAGLRYAWFLRKQQREADARRAARLRERVI